MSEGTGRGREGGKEGEREWHCEWSRQSTGEERVKVRMGEMEGWRIKRGIKLLTIPYLRV